MSTDRTQAYRRVLQTLEDLGPSKLQEGEQERIRFAADSLIFSSDLGQDAGARESLEAPCSIFQRALSGARVPIVPGARVSGAPAAKRHCT